MSDKLMDTQELSEIRRMIGESAPQEEAGDKTGKLPKPAGDPPEKKQLPSTATLAGTGKPNGFDINDIIAEVSGVVDSPKSAQGVRTVRPPTQQTGSVSKRTGSVPTVTQRMRTAARTSHPGSQRTGPVSQRTGTIPRPGQPVSQRTGPVSQRTGAIPRVSQAQGVSQRTGPISQKTGKIPGGGVTQHTIQIPKSRLSDSSLHIVTAAGEAARPAPVKKEEAPRLSRKEQKKLERARRRERERKEDEEEEIVIHDPRIAQRKCAKRAKNLAARSLIVLALGAAAVYITVAGGMGLPLPAVLDYATSPFLSILSVMLLQFLAMFIGLDVVGMGFYNLCTGHADRASLVSCAMLASLIHGMTIILFPTWGGWLPYCAVSIVLLFASMQEEKARMSGRYRAYKAATLGDRPTAVYCHHDSKERVRRAVKYRIPDVNAFLRELERQDYTERFAQLYTPLVLAASVIFALISSIGHGEPTRFFWALSAILSIAAPLGVVSAFGAPYRNVSRRLLAEGAAIAGARHAHTLRRAKEAVLRDGDLFPAGSITVEEIRNYGNYSPEKLLAYAAAVTGGEGLEIGRVLAEALHERYGRPLRASNIMHYESGGISADINSDSVLVGTAAFLGKLGIRVKDTHGIENGVFIVINSQIAGEIALSYHPTAQTYGAIHVFSRLKIRPVIAAQDFNISPAMVESLFEIRRGVTDELDPARVEELKDPNYAASDRVCAILSKDGAMPFAQVQQAADKLSGAVRSNLILGAVAGVCGILLMFYLTFLYAVEAVEPKNVLLYILLWYVPVYVISRQTKKNY